MEKDPELDELLSELRSEGELDSTGTFAVDFLEAQRKLGQYQLGRPGEGLLKVIQACVAGGAAEVQLGNRGSRVVLKARARFPVEELRKLSHYLLHSQMQGPRGLHHLAVGLNALVGTRPRKLELRYDNLLWTPENEWTELPREEPPGLELAMTRGEATEKRWERLHEALRVPLSLVPHYLRRAGQADLDEVALRTIFAPVPVRLNKVLLNSPSLEELFPPRRHILQLGIMASGEAASQLIGIPVVRQARMPAQIWAPSLHSLPAPRLKQSQPPPAIPVLGTQGRMALAHGLLIMLSNTPTSEAALVFVQDGVTLALKRADLGFPGVVAILSAHGLQTDLSGFELVEDERYQGLLSRLRLQVRDLVEHVRGELGTAGLMDWMTWRAPFL